jgi:hypothetical protein
VAGDEIRAFARAVLRVFQTAFPFERRPPFIAMSSKLGKYRVEIDLTVAAPKCVLLGASVPGIGRLRIPPGDEVEESVIDRRVQDRRLIVLQPLFP